MFDDLRQAVNRTHGSLHHAFLAWDKTGSGELSKAKLRVGLRACRGALEKDVQAFTEALGDLDDGKITFNRLYQCFHEGERRFPSGTEKTSPNRRKSLPVFFDHSPVYLSQGNASRLLAEEEEKMSNEITSVKIPQSAKQEVYRSPLQHNVVSSPYKTPPRSPSPLSRTASPSSPSSANVSRRLDFSGGTMERKEDTQSETSSQNRSVTSPRAISPSSARFQKMREAKALPPSTPAFGIASSLSTASPRPLEHIASSVFARSATSIGRSPRPFQSSAAYDLSERRLSMTKRANNSLQSSSLPRGESAYRSSQPFYRFSPKKSQSSRTEHEESHATSTVGERFDRYSPVKASPGFCRSAWLPSSTVSASADWSLSNRRPVEDEMDISKPFEVRDDVESLLNDSVRTELRTTLLTLASETPSLPMEATIAPSDLRRTLHTVDPSLSRHEVKILARHLLGSYSPQRVKISRVLEVLGNL